MIQLLQVKFLACDQAQRMAEFFFSFLGDANRLRMLSVLAEKNFVHGLAALNEVNQLFPSAKNSTKQCDW